MEWTTEESGFDRQQRREKYIMSTLPTLFLGPIHPYLRVVKLITSIRFRG
jgi:hypothetical protein